MRSLISNQKPPKNIKYVVGRVGYQRAKRKIVAMGLSLRSMMSLCPIEYKLQVLKRLAHPPGFLWLSKIFYVL